MLDNIANKYQPLLDYASEWFGFEELKGRRANIAQKKTYLQGLIYALGLNNLNHIKDIIYRDHSTQIKLWRLFINELEFNKRKRKDFFHYIVGAEEKNLITITEKPLSYHRNTNCFYDGVNVVLSSTQDTLVINESSYATYKDFITSELSNINNYKALKKNT